MTAARADASLADAPRSSTTRSRSDAATLRAPSPDCRPRPDGAHPLFFETTVDDLGDGVTREALAQKADAVLVAGGDGTVRAVVEALSRLGRAAHDRAERHRQPARAQPLPAAHRPRRDDRARRSTATGCRSTSASPHSTRADGTVEERAFVVMGGMGLDAAMIANTSGDLKKRVGLDRLRRRRGAVARRTPSRSASCTRSPGDACIRPGAEHPVRQLRVAPGRARADPRGIGLGRRARHRDLPAQERPRAGCSSGDGSRGTTASCAASAPGAACSRCGRRTTRCSTPAARASRSRPRPGAARAAGRRRVRRGHPDQVPRGGGRAARRGAEGARHLQALSGRRHPRRRRTLRDGRSVDRVVPR